LARTRALRGAPLWTWTLARRAAAGCGERAGWRGEETTLLLLRLRILMGACFGLLAVLVFTM